MVHDFVSKLECCASGVNQAYFGGGTKLTVLGKKYHLTNQLQLLFDVIHFSFGYLCKEGRVCSWQIF